MLLRSFLGVEALGRKGPVPASIFPPVGLSTGPGMGVLSNGVLNEHPSFSVNSCALRAEQLCSESQPARMSQDG